ncbi:MAG: hypothetical protein H0W72_14215 [Planctomycetes bacterium]|nr:hypothetical protein [Planctomycetota bacterium]
MRFALRLLPLAAPMTLAAADLCQETAAWAPLPSVNTGLIAAEHRPVDERYGQWFVNGLALTGARARNVGLVVREREDDLSVDGQFAAGWAAGECGGSSRYFTSTSRHVVYLRAGSDPRAREPSLAGAVGAAALISIGGGPTMAWAEVGHSEERGTIVYGEVSLLLYHLVLDSDDDAHALRHGLCFRWPGGTLARSPQDDPWSFALALDRVQMLGDERFTGWAGQLTLGWRIGQHLLATGQVEMLSSQRGPDPDDRGGQVTGTFGLGAVF